jgi:hypothetical protein
MAKILIKMTDKGRFKLTEITQTGDNKPFVNIAFNQIKVINHLYNTGVFEKMIDGNQKKIYVDILRDFDKKEPNLNKDQIDIDKKTTTTQAVDNKKTASIDDLKMALKKLGISQSGNKDDLIDRLLKHKLNYNVTMVSLKQYMAKVGLNKVGTKDELIDRMILHLTF